VIYRCQDGEVNAMVRFLHTSDWQIGMKGSGLGAAGERVARARIQAVDRVLTIAEQKAVDFVVACGDLFEHNQVAQDVVEELARLIAGHRTIDVHAIPGNHDLPGPGSVWNRSALRAVPNLHVHVDPTPVPLPKATLHPFPVMSRYSGTDPLAGLADLRSEPGIHVGVAHGHLTSVTFGAHEEDIRLPLDPAHVDRAGLDYLALGHWHGQRIVRLRDGAPRIAYSGTHEQTSFRESDAGNVLLVEISEKGAPPVLTPLRAGTFAWERLAFSTAGDLDVARLRAAVLASKADFLELTVDGDLPSSVFSSYRDVVAEAEGSRVFLVLRDTLRWTSESPSTTAPIADAGLAEIDRRLAEAAATGDQAATVRAAREAFRRLVSEVVP